MDYETLIQEKFPTCAVEILTPNIFELEKLIEYITDDIIVLKPHSVIVHRHLIRFLSDDGGKIYYLDGFSDEQLDAIHGGF